MVVHCYNTGKIALRSKHNINNLAFYIPSLVLPQNPSAILSKSTESLPYEMATMFLCLTLLLK